jgi:hypothetical protein
MFMHETLQVETGCKFYFDLLSCQLVMLLIQNEEEIVAGKKKARHAGRSKKECPTHVTSICVTPSFKGLLVATFELSLLKNCTAHPVLISAPMSIVRGTVSAHV